MTSWNSPSMTQAAKSISGFAHSTAPKEVVPAKSEPLPAEIASRYNCLVHFGWPLLVLVYQEKYRNFLSQLDNVAMRWK